MEDVLCHTTTILSLGIGMHCDIVCLRCRLSLFFFFSLSLYPSLSLSLSLYGDLPEKIERENTKKNK